MLTTRNTKEHPSQRKDMRLLFILLESIGFGKFFVKKLKFQWDEVHDVAEQLEHIKSPKLVEHLDTFMFSSI